MTNFEADQPTPEIDWSNPEAVEALLAQDGMGDIDAQIAGDSATIEQSTALTLWTGINERSQWPALPIITIQSTLDRYQGDDLGAAMAADITQPLVPELPLDGSLSDNETEPIDSIVHSLRVHGLSGVSIDAIARFLGVDLDLGALDGLMTINAELVNNADALREQFAQDLVRTAEEQAEEAEYIDSRFDPVEDESDEDFDDPEADDEFLASDNGVVDESGEEFEL